MSDEQPNQDESIQNTLKPIGDLTIFEAAQFHEDLCLLHQQAGPVRIGVIEG